MVRGSQLWQVLLKRYPVGSSVYESSGWQLPPVFMEIVLCAGDWAVSPQSI